MQQRKWSSGFANLPQSVGNRARRIIGRRKHLKSLESTTLNPHAIGERASRVDCDAPVWRGRPRPRPLTLQLALLAGRKEVRNATREPWMQKMDKEDYHCQRPAQ